LNLSYPIIPYLIFKGYPQVNILVVLDGVFAQLFSPGLVLFLNVAQAIPLSDVHSISPFVFYLTKLCMVAYIITKQIHWSYV